MPDQHIKPPSTPQCFKEEPELSAKDTRKSREGLYHMDNGLFVFSPTAVEFTNFTNFLQEAEEIAGREHGVVKVIVPTEW